MKNTHDERTAAFVGICFSTVVVIFIFRGVFFVPGYVVWADFTFPHNTEWTKLIMSYTWNIWKNSANLQWMPFPLDNIWALFTSETETHARILIFMVYFMMSFLMFISTFLWTKQKFVLGV
jgi:hypothetical protein